MSKFYDLMRFEGFEDENEFMEEIGYDSIVPGICINPGCDYTRDVEPDCQEGYCEDCKTHTIQSALILLGVI